MTDLIHIDGLTFEVDAWADSVWVATGFEGWYSSPPVRVPVDDRPNADGAFGIQKAYRSARVLRFEGHLLGSSRSQAQEELYDAFAAIQGSGEPISISVETENGVRSVTASLTGTADVTPHPTLTGATVVARFVCFDPVKYGPSVSLSTDLPSAGGGLEYNLFNGGSGGSLYYGALGNLGRVTLVNTGTADTWPVFTVSGLLADGFVIQCLSSGMVLRYDRVVPAGTTVTIDSRTGSVLIDGVSDGSTYLTRDEFFPVPAMGTCEVQFSAVSTGSAASMEATSRSGWW